MEKISKSLWVAQELHHCMDTKTLLYLVVKKIVESVELPVNKVESLVLSIAEYA